MFRFWFLVIFLKPCEILGSLKGHRATRFLRSGGDSEDSEDDSEDHDNPDDEEGSGDGTVGDGGNFELCIPSTGEAPVRLWTLSDVSVDKCFKTIAIPLVLAPSISLFAAVRFLGLGRTKHYIV